MGNCCRSFARKRLSSTNRQKKIVLLLVGLDNAGKTSAAKGLVGESLDTVVPTVGFSSISLTYQKYSVLIYDLGGGPQIRGIWPRYFTDVHGVIFVVDASDVSRLDECRKVLENILSHEKLCGKPVLLLANKQDCEGALDELDIVEKLDVESLVNQQRCPTMVETCSAVTANAKQKLDPAIHNGYKWLLNCVIQDFVRLDSRVETDLVEQRRVQELERKARLERIRQVREERGENSSSDCKEEAGDADGMAHNPFRPVAEVVKNIQNGVVERSELADSSVILVKESPHKVEAPKRFRKQVSNGSVKFVDIDGDEVSLVSRGSTTDELTVEAPSFMAGITELIKEQLELEAIHHKRRPFLRRANKTAPAPVDSGVASPVQEETNTIQDSGFASPRRQLPPLPPLRRSTVSEGATDRVPWVRAPLSAPLVGRSSQDAAWDLDKSLEVVTPSTESKSKDAASCNDEVS